MDVSGISSTGSALTQGGLNEAVQVAVLKKAIDIEAQGALQLIQGAAQVTATNPPNLGNGVDTFACRWAEVEMKALLRRGFSFILREQFIQNHY